jgi:hypothetical protein
MVMPKNIRYLVRRLGEKMRRYIKNSDNLVKRIAGG